MKIKIMKSLLSVAVLAAMTNGAFAAIIGTPAGDLISNTATISYQVGGVGQTNILSSPDGLTPTGLATTFVVDKKIDLLVTGTAGTTSVIPAQSVLGAGVAAVPALTYTLKNEGNSTESFNLTASDDLTLGAGDEFNSTGCTTSPAGPVSLASGASASITVKCDIPAASATVKNGAQTVVDLLATINGVAASTGADTAGMDVVYADGAGTSKDAGGETGGATTGNRNGKHSAANTYIVSTAELKVEKTQIVTAMSMDLGATGGAADTITAGNLFHIPGATVQYNVIVTNTAGEATNLTISDLLPSTLTYVSCSFAGDAVENTGDPALVLPSTTACTISGTTVSSPSFTLQNGSITAQVATLTIFATIK